MQLQFVTLVRTLSGRPTYILLSKASVSLSIISHHSCRLALNCPAKATTAGVIIDAQLRDGTKNRLNGTVGTLESWSSLRRLLYVRPVSCVDPNHCCRLASEKLNWIESSRRYALYDQQNSTQVHTCGVSNLYSNCNHYPFLRTWAPLCLSFFSTYKVCTHLAGPYHVFYAGRSLDYAQYDWTMVHAPSPLHLSARGGPAWKEECIHVKFSNDDIPCDYSPVAPVSCISSWCVWKVLADSQR